MDPHEYCQTKAAQSGSSFYYSFLFLPQERRRAITALYAFCREVDDVVDECSDAICSSLQLINFIQDIEIDFRKNRVYLPKDEMAEYGVTEAQIAARDSGTAWQALMMFQIERARSMLLAGAPLARRLPGRVGLELRMIVMGGSRVLDKLRASRGDVFRQRPVLQPYDWLAMLLRSFFAYP